MATTSKPRKPPTEATYRRWCRKLAAIIGATIDPERNHYVGASTYWVHGADELYTEPEHSEAIDQLNPCPICGRVEGWCDPPRRDPCEGDHAAAGWGEAWDKLLAFAQDFRFHRAGLSSKDAARVLYATAGRAMMEDGKDDGAALLDAFLGDPRRPDASFPADICGIFADWLADNGAPEAAPFIRAAAIAFPDGGE